MVLWDDGRPYGRIQETGYSQPWYQWQNGTSWLKKGLLLSSNSVSNKVHEWDGKGSFAAGVSVDVANLKRASLGYKRQRLRGATHTCLCRGNFFCPRMTEKQLSHFFSFSFPPVLASFHKPSYTLRRLQGSREMLPLGPGRTKDTRGVILDPLPLSPWMKKLYKTWPK